jgi:glyoxylase-like metal-dependent hydrolase (beta-lactamase superfamily II)
VLASISAASLFWAVAAPWWDFPFGELDSARNLLLAGDALATYAVTTGARGPQVAPFTADAAQAVASLARLEEVAAGLVLPGHGDPWTGGIQEAVRQVRQGASS